MAHHFTLSSNPTNCQSPTASLPEHRALLIGINYTSFAGDYEHGCRQLKGAVNDAKEVKGALIELFDYKEEDICLITDEEANMDTALWPSKANIMHALRDLVRGARPGDAFIFFYAGNCGQRPATIDINKIDGLDNYIITCDFKTILNSTLREYLVDPLPAGTRLTAILDASFSGTLLDLDHYFCHCFLPYYARCPIISEPKQVGVVVGTSIPHLPCRVSSCVNTLLKVPLVISLASCSDGQSAWEDSQNKGRGMTTELVNILTKNPSINLGALNQQLQKRLSGMAFKRVKRGRSAFNMYAVKLSPKMQEKYKDVYTERGVFELKEQTAQFGSLQPLCQEELFIVKKGYIPDLQQQSRRLQCISRTLADVADSFASRSRIRRRTRRASL